MHKAILFLCMLTVPIGTHAAFPDVPADHPHAVAIEFVEQNGLVNGYPDGTFRPDNRINRAEFTKIIVTAVFSENEIATCNWENLSFTDVKISDWFAKYVCVAREKSIITGYPDGTFGAANTINYAESAKIITEAFDLPQPAQRDAWYNAYVDALQQVNATPEKDILPEALITRGHMAQMVYAIENKTVEDTQIASSECVVFDDFTTPDTNNWVMVNDNVMGGRSIGDFTIKSGHMTMFGEINTNGGGFSSVRTPLTTGSFSQYNTIKVRAKTDGRDYQITLRDGNPFGVSHRYTLPISNTNEWQTLYVPFTSLTPAFFGQTVDAAPFQKDTAREIGFILNDGRDGTFNLEIDALELCVR